jgi:DNA transposition AAA+ family ATPase
MASSYKRIKAGELDYADLHSGDTLYVTNTDRFFKDTTIETKNGFSYEKGRILRGPAVSAFNAYISDCTKSDDEAAERAKFRNLQEFSTVDDFFDTVMELSGIGFSSALILTLAVKGDLPDINRCLGTKVHNELFLNPADKTSYVACRPDYTSTLLDVNTAKSCALRLAAYTISDAKLAGDTATPQTVAEYALTNRTAIHNGKIGDADVIAAEEKLFALAYEQCLNRLKDLCDSTVIDTQGALFDDQLSAFNGIMMGSQRVTLMDGCPGSGKSHIITAIVRSMPKGSVLCTAYTNKACLNLSERLLDDYEFGGEQPGVIPNILSCYYRTSEKWLNALCNVRLLIVDEASIIGSDILVKLMALLDKCSQGCRLLLVGDPMQLPPVLAYGTVFHNAIRNRAFSRVTLSGFHRSNGEGIYRLFSTLRQKSGGILLRKESDDVKLATFHDVDGVCEVASRLMNTFDDPKEFAVIAETNAITDAINRTMAATAIGIKPDEIITSKVTKKPLPIYNGVRVIATDNIRNGKKVSVGRNEFGVVEEISQTMVTLRMDIRNRQVMVDYNTFMHHFSFGYCQTVHKFQGSEAPTVMYVFENGKNLRGNAFYSQKELKYVGLSRAKKELFVAAIDPSCQKRWRKDEAIPLTVYDLAKATMCF